MADSELLAQLSKLIFTDDLTGLYNRRFLQFYFKQQRPPQRLALLLIDVDRFKSINDSYGHPEGDSVLKQVARVLAENVAPDDLVVRNGGDEFCILFPNADKPRARATAESILAAIARKPIHIAKLQRDITVTLSMGLAALPDDAADPDLLIEAADAALYHTKHTGRGRLTVAGEFDAAPALDEKRLAANFSHPPFVGRSSELGTLNSELGRALRGSPQLVLVTGPSGIGKSRMLRETMRLAESQRTIYVFSRCTEHSGLSPYRVLVNLLTAYAQNHLEHTRKLLESLSDEEYAALAKIFPTAVEITGRSALPSPLSPRPLFSALTGLVWDIASKSGLVLLIDNFHYVDLGTQEVLKWLLNAPECRLLVCAAANDLKPVKLFLQAARHTRIDLAPLAPAEITALLDLLLPNTQRPPDFDSALPPGGNPLHIIAALKFWINQGCIERDAGGWVFNSPLSPLPSTLDSLIAELLSSLDHEAVEVITNVAVMGESFHIDTVKGVVEKNEGELLDILDRLIKSNLLEAAGLSDFAFTSKKTQEVGYGAIDPNKRKSIHRKIAEVEEKRSPDADTLAYHFMQADDPRAEKYRALLSDRQALIVHADEVARIPEQTAPVDADTARHVIHALVAAVRTMRVYPAGAPVVDQTRRALFDALASAPPITLSRDRRGLLVNGQPAADPEKLLDLFEEKRIRSLTFIRGLAESELAALLSALVDRRAAPDWQQFTEPHIGVLPFVFVATADTGSLNLTQETAALVRDAMKYFKAAVDAVRVYPAGSAVIKDNIRLFFEALDKAFAIWPTVTVGVVEGKLVANTVPIGPAPDFLGGRTFTFTRGLALDETEQLVCNLASPPSLPHVAVSAVQFQLKAFGEIETRTLRASPAELAQRLLDLPTEEFLARLNTQLVENLVVDKHADLAAALLKKLSELLTHPHELHRARAAELVEAFLASPVAHDVVPLDPIVDALRAEESPTVRNLLVSVSRGIVARALEAPDLDVLLRLLWPYHGKPLPDPLRALDYEKVFRRFPDPRARNILLALGPLAVPRVVRMILEKGTHDAQWLLRELAADAAPQHLLDALTPETPADHAINALRSLAAIAKGKQLSLAKLLGHRDPRVHAELLRAAAELSDLALLRSSLPNRRTEVLALATELKLAPLAPDILLLFRAATDDDTVLQCCKFFSVCPDPAAVPDLIRVYERRSTLFRRGFKDSTRAAAIVALSKLDHPDARRTIELATKDKSLKVRSAAKALLHP